LLIGIITGTYSSIYVASPVLILYEDFTKNRIGRAVPKRA
jgi:preprotein translocase subunit SecF